MSQIKLEYYMLQGLHGDEYKYYKLFRYHSRYKHLIQASWILVTLGGLLIFSGAWAFHVKYTGIQKDFFTQTYRDVLYQEYHIFTKCTRNSNRMSDFNFITYGALVSFASIMQFYFQSRLLSLKNLKYSEDSETYSTGNMRRLRRQSSSESSSYEYSIMLKRLLKYISLLTAINGFIFVLVFTLLEHGYCIDPPICENSSQKSMEILKIEDDTKVRFTSPLERGFYYLTWDPQHFRTCCGISNKDYRTENTNRHTDMKSNLNVNLLRNCAGKCGNDVDHNVGNSITVACEGSFRLEYLKGFYNYKNGCKEAIEKHYKTMYESRCVLFYANRICLTGMYIIASCGVSSIFLTAVVIMQLIQNKQFTDIHTL